MPYPSEGLSNGHWTIATLDQATFETVSYKLVNIYINYKITKVDIWKKKKSKYVHLPYFTLYQFDEDMFTYSINFLFSYV